MSAFDGGKEEWGEWLPQPPVSAWRVIGLTIIEGLGMLALALAVVVIGSIGW